MGGSTEMIEEAAEEHLIPGNSLSDSGNVCEADISECLYLHRLFIFTVCLMLRGKQGNTHYSHEVTHRYFTYLA